MGRFCDVLGDFHHGSSRGDQRSRLSYAQSAASDDGSRRKVEDNSMTVQPPQPPPSNGSGREGQTFFGQEQVPSTANPDIHPIDREPGKKLGKYAAIGAGAVAAIAVLGIGAKMVIGIGAEEIGTNMGKNLAGGGSSNSAGRNPGETADYSKVNIATTSNEAFTSLPYAVQLEKTQDYFKDKLENGSMTQEYAEDAKLVNGYDLQGGVGEGTVADDTPQELVNRETVTVNHIRHLVANPGNLNLALNLLSYVYEPDTPLYREETTTIEEIDQSNVKDLGEMTPTTTGAFDSSKVFTQGSFDSIEANGNKTIVFNASSLVSGRVYNVVIQDRQVGDDPNNTTAIVMHVLNAKSSAGSINPGWVEDLTNWTPQP